LNKQSILLVSYGLFEKDFLEKIAADVSREFRLPVLLEESHLDLTGYYDPARRQYDGNQLLKMLDALYQNSGMKVMGLFRVDLFIPILTYIFGQAIFRGRTGIASLYRLRNEQYGMKRNDKLLYERFRKVVIHELGHSFGLTHCLVPSCVMRSATYVEDIDQKKHLFCSKCQESLVWESGSWR
jgi:archaemetzincin